MNGKKDSMECRDIFEDVLEKAGCHFLSDLRWNQSKVREILKTLSTEDYTEEQIQELKSYVFGK